MTGVGGGRLARDVAADALHDLGRLGGGGIDVPRPQGQLRRVDDVAAGRQPHRGHGLTALLPTAALGRAGDRGGRAGIAARTAKPPRRGAVAAELDALPSTRPGMVSAEYGAAEPRARRPRIGCAGSARTGPANPVLSACRCDDAIPPWFRGTGHDHAPARPHPGHNLASARLDTWIPLTHGRMW